VALFLSKTQVNVEYLRALAANPTDREPALKATFEANGAQLVGIYWAPEQSAVYSIAEAADASVFDRLFFAVGASGVLDISASSTTRLVSMADLAEIAKAAPGAGYQPPSN
jgi:uncharacterized protein with GYD domain